jgi:DNA-binding LytR/AlgR family response regulator
VGFAEPFIPAAGDIVPLTMRPVVQDNRVIGILGTLGEQEGEELTLAAASAQPSPPELRQVVGLQANRLIFLHPEQIIFAEAEGNTVWLTTDHGRIRARERGLAKLVADLGDVGFIRVHHHFAVNSRRVREIRRGFRGQLSLVMGPGCRKAVPVSRRREPAVRRALML